MHVEYAALAIVQWYNKSKPNPNLAKSGKAQPSRAKENQRERLEFPWILLSELSLFNDLH
jgi:hypothetical protein